MLPSLGVHQLAMYRFLQQMVASIAQFLKPVICLLIATSARVFHLTLLNLFDKVYGSLSD